MRALKQLLLGSSLIVAGCATPMAMRDIEAIRPNCARIDRQIATLEQEKGAGAHRVEPGARHL
jgi:hypothetical protein